MDIRYFAGFFDGEGCISIVHTKGNNNYRLNVQVSNTNKYVLMCFKKRFGGYVTPLIKRSDRHTQAYVWKLADAKAGTFLKEINPYLIVKKPQGELALHFQNRINANGGNNTPLTDEERLHRKELKEKLLAIKHS